jgi:hypothetical protein
VKSLEANIIQHCLLEHLFNAHTGGYSADEMANRVIAIKEDKIIHATCQEDLQENKVLPNSVFAGGLHLDMMRPGVLLATPLPSGQD